MTESKAAKAHKVGDVLEGVKTVTRPGASVSVAVTDGLYVLDVAGTYVVDGSEVTVK